MTVLESIRNWLAECPLLADGRLDVNYLGSDAVEYAVIEVPSEPIVQKYLDGSSSRQKLVALAAVRDYSCDIVQSIAESGFWESVAKWIEEQDDSGNLPTMSEGMTATAVKMSTSHYLLQTTAQTARYQIQLRLEYDKERTDEYA